MGQDGCQFTVAVLWVFFLHTLWWLHVFSHFVHG